MNQVQPRDPNPGGSPDAWETSEGRRLVPRPSTIDRLTAERDDWERLYHEAFAAGVRDVERLTTERDAARGDVERLLAEKLPEGTTLHRMATTYPAFARRAYEQDAERLRADNAALVEAGERLIGSAQPWQMGSRDRTWGRVVTAETFDQLGEALANHGKAGAAILAELTALRRLREAARDVDNHELGAMERLAEALAAVPS